eukprot:8322937-Pyramimonas_sp.AAC.1
MCIRDRSTPETRLALIVDKDRFLDMIEFDRQVETPMAVARHAWHPAQNSAQQCVGRCIQESLVLVPPGGSSQLHFTGAANQV